MEPISPLTDLFALGAAACWATSSLLAVTPVRHLGAFAFTRWRMGMVAVMLWVVVLLTGSWRTLSWDVNGTLALSGLVGIFIGDTALFGVTQRLGPRRSSVLFAMHVAFMPSLDSSCWASAWRCRRQWVAGTALILLR